MIINTFISIDYVEGEAGTYRACVVAGPGDFMRRFETGDPVKDFAEAVTFGEKHARENGVQFMTLSSIDHFVQDDPGYVWSQDGSDLLERRT